MAEQMNLPANMTEDQVLQIVRELCGDDMTDDELRSAYQSGMFHELCPDIEQYANQRHGGDDETKTSSSDKNKDVIPSKDREEKKTESHSYSSKAIKAKEDADSESESVISGRHSHHKKKKKKHSKDHKKRSKDKEDRKEKKERSHEDRERTKKSQPEVLNLDSSDSENERRRKEEKIKKEKKKRTVVFSSSSDNESDREKNKHKNEQVVKPVNNSESKVTNDDNEKAKIHPFYLEKSNDAGVNQPSTSTNKEPQETKREKTPERKKEPKPFSKYNSSVSQVKLNRWRPILHKEHLRYQRKFRLKPLSVVCVDLLDLPMVFHHPNKHNKCPNAIPLKRTGVTMSPLRMDMVRRLERDKANWFRKKINRRAQKFLKFNKNKRYDSSDDDGRKHKRARIMDRIVSSSDSNSDTSSIMVPNKKARKDQDDNRGGKLTKAQKEAEARKKKLEEVKKKAGKYSERGTRILPWENKDKYFKGGKKKDDPEKEKERLIAEKKKRIEQARKEKLEQQKNAPSVSFQRILKQIETANKEQAAKPRVELKIPKKNQNPDRPVPISEYKLDGKIGVGDVYKEVTKLLSRNVLVECPDMPEAGDDLGEYTVKKISWWILKNEKDPAIEGLFHPECHDDEERESIHDDDFDWPSDVSSIVGCVSDPEGIAAEITPDPKKVQDPDWADDYCGEASLYAKFRKETKEAKDRQFPIDSTEPFKGFLRVKPGTNYSKPNFEVKCFVCNEVLRGQRQYGAHVRSESHKNNFRNFSLDMANYEERLVNPEPKKVFVAKLVEYSAGANVGNTNREKSDMSAATKHKVGRIERVRSDSPGPIIGGDAAPNIMVHQIPIPDDISLPSYEDYDISSDESLMNVRVAIITAAKWDDDLEKRWRTWRDEEAKIAEEYNGERDYFINAPERHPNYEEEWLKFWDQRCTELEAEGKDTENYNFHKEWLPFWLKRMQEIMQEKVEMRVAELKRSLRIDKHTLRMQHAISAEATKRKKKKRKVGKMEEENSSSIKTSDKVDSTGHGPTRQPMASSNVHQRNQNNVHSKPECLPTPPVTDEGRSREMGSSNNSNDSQKVPGREEKSGDNESHSKHDAHHKSRNDKHDDRHHKSRNDKHDDKHHRSHSDKRDDKHRNKRDDRHRRHDDDKHHKSRNDKQDKSHREDDDKNHKHDRRPHSERISSRSPDNSNSRSNSANVKYETKSISSVSSIESAPPGKEPLLLGSSSKPGRPPPAISVPFSKQAKEVHKRIASELRQKLASGNQLADQNTTLISHDKKPNEDSIIDNPSNVILNSKNVTSWSDNSSNEGKVKNRHRFRRDSDISSNSSGSNARTLQARLKALRRALADDEARTNPNQSERPKVIPLERSDKPANLSDGEVASDISDLDINATKGVSTFVNKGISGLANLEKAAPSTSNLDKNSLGYHLLERKKSTEEQPTSSSSHAERPKQDKRDDKFGKNQHFKKERHGKSHHNPRHDDRQRHKNDYRGGPNKDDRRRWDNSNRNHNNKDFRGPRDFKHKNNNQQPFKNNQYNSSGPARPLPVEESWEPEDSWEPQPQAAVPPPLFPPAYAPPFVPDNTSHIPVLDSASRQPHQPFNSHDQGHWNGGWGGNQGYPPHMTDPNNYYNNY